MAMTGLTTPPRYTMAQMALHWLTALCVIIAIPLAFGMNNVPEGSLQDSLFRYHESFGILIWVLALLRVLTKLSSPKLPYDPPISSFEKAASASVHGILYLLLVFMPIAGYFSVGAFPANAFFFVTELPNWVPVSLQYEAFAQSVSKAHKLGGYLMTGLVVLHIAAAIKHGLVNRDGVFSRMWPSA